MARSATIGRPVRGLGKWLATFFTCRELGLVLIFYVASHSALIWAGRGYPYGLDNNESYSSWWHARSLFENGIAHTKGLTDEVFSTDAAASPYIHSHQGNFPRLFTYVVYALGFRSIESHVIITTFTVGLVAILLAFRFFAELVRPGYAAVACVVMMSNYLLFAQWQVSLYNVWHAFFFFSSLRCMQTLANAQRHRRWWLITTLNFAALFYWEYVFTSFTVVLCGLYTVAENWRKPRLIVIAASAVAAGALAAAGTLLWQLNAYMGWANVLTDIRLTLTARNASADPDLLRQVTSFYEANRIIFWHNFFDAEPLRNARAFADSIRQHHLAHYSLPVAATIAVAVVAGGIAAITPWFDRITERLRLGTRGIVSYLALSLAAAGVFGLLLASTFPNGTPRGLLPVGAAAATVVIVLSRIMSGRWWPWPTLPVGESLAVGSYLLLAAKVTAWVQATPSADSAEIGGSWSQAPWMVLVLGTTAIGLTWIAESAASRRRQTTSTSMLSGLSLLVLAAFVAYAITYRIFTGYVFSGYLHRLVPLLVFVTDGILGMVIYSGGRRLLQDVKAARDRSAASPSNSGHRGPFPIGLRTGMLAAYLFAVSAQWAAVQVDSVRLVRPDSYAFLRELDRPELQGKSLVANTYPAPMVARTGSWGYADTAIFSGRLQLESGGFVVERNLQYLWMADRDTNSDYLHPDLAISVVHAPNPAEARQRESERQERSDRGAARVPPGIVRRATSSFQPYLQHRLIYTDGERVDVVALDWDFPPFLEPQHLDVKELTQRLTLREKLAVSQMSDDAWRRWRIAWSWLDAEPGKGAPPIEVRVDEQLWPADKLSEVVVVSGSRLEIKVNPAPDAAQFRLSVNNVEEVIDPSTLVGSGVTYTWSSSAPYGPFMRMTPSPPGFFLRAELIRSNAESRKIKLSYDYRHQRHVSEENSVLRLYHENAPGTWSQLDEVVLLRVRELTAVRLDEFKRNNPDTLLEHEAARSRGDRRSYVQWLSGHLGSNPQELDRPGVAKEIVVSESKEVPGHTTIQYPLGNVPGSGSLRFTLSPATATKLGPEYSAATFDAAWDVPGPITLRVSAGDTGDSLPYGALRLKVRFPPDRWPQAEPILTTGANEAGDIVYVIYHDQDHIRIGLDHWFSGGPLTAPIKIDYTQEHTLEISLGSLYPPKEAVVFAEENPALVASLKRRVVIRLNGQTLIDAESDFYESSPNQIRLGRNEINATSCGPEFFGTITEAERFWPSHFPTEATRR